MSSAGWSSFPRTRTHNLDIQKDGEKGGAWLILLERGADGAEAVADGATV